LVDDKENSFYDAAPLEPHLVYQGEILTDVPIFNMPLASRWLLVRTGKGGPVMEALNSGQTPGLVKVWDSNKTEQLWNEAGVGDYALGYLRKVPVLVLSQTCDIAQKTFIQIAPVFTAEGDPKHIERLAAREIWSAFPLIAHAPQIAQLSFADLEQIQAIHKSYIKRIKPEQHFRISPANVRELQYFITRYFGRPNSYDADQDKAPREGHYLCVSCFYMHGDVVDTELKEGQDFPHCECGGRLWVVRGA
jgi:hypothetical protein